jgi:Ca2+/H+ antiporter
MSLWLLPMTYVGASVVCGLALPRIEQAYLASYTLNLSVASAQAYLSAILFCHSAACGIHGPATEQLAEQMGEGVGGLPNATFGNAAELIIELRHRMPRA